VLDLPRGDGGEGKQEMELTKPEKTIKSKMSNLIVPKKF
jgi:hypothetical protein